MLGIAVPDSEFSRPFSVEALDDQSCDRSVVASPAECEAVARRLGLLGVECLEAELSLKRPNGGPLVRLEGRFTARVVQRCVVSLEPLEGSLAEDFSQLYSLEPPVLEDGLELSLEDQDLPEEILNGTIDLGEAVVQQLAVALDPYPRRPEAEVPGRYVPGPDDGGEKKPSPFAVLKTLKGSKPG